MTAPRSINHQMTPFEWLLLLTLSLVWAGSFLFNGIAIRELPVLTIVVGRVGIASLLCWWFCAGPARPCHARWAYGALFG